jgi:hypothetical protein
MVREVVKSEVYFLKRNALYQEEKPYSLRFNPEGNFPRSNIELESREIEVRDVRPEVEALTFNKDKFAVIPLNSKMAYDDFDNEQKVRDVYLKEVADALKTFLGASLVQVFEHTASKIIVNIQGPC